MSEKECACVCVCVYVCVRRGGGGDSSRVMWCECGSLVSLSFNGVRVQDETRVEPNIVEQRLHK